MERTVRSAWLGLALSGILGTSPSLAQETNGEPLPALQAARISDGQSIDLDGRIEEPAWQAAMPITDFTQQEPVEGGQPSRRTEIRVTYDDDNLYIGAILYDDPDRILAYARQRDAFLSADDRFMWILDTFKDGRTGYFFETNANGMLGDALLTSGGGGPGEGGGGGGRAWNGIWNVRTHIRPDGWSLEIAIPFRTLNFDPESDEWGINFQRTIRRDNEEILWRGWRRSQGLRRPVYAGRLVGLRGMSQGIGLEAVPSTIASWRNVPGADQPTTYPSDLSLDVNYSVTSSLRASLSINTDFAEVEADQRRVNLTRFSLRFPERRGFFLEGSGVFDFAPRSGPEPFFSRNIGLNEGQQVPIRYGARITGQVGRTEVGFFQVGTGSKTFLSEGEQLFSPSEQFSVARVRQPIFEQSTIGAIYTRRSSSEDAVGFRPEVGQTFGVDLDLATRHFLGDHQAEMEAFVVWNSNPDPSLARSFGDLSARGIRFAFPNDIWNGHLSYREFGGDYLPTLGFVPRNDFRRVEPRIEWRPRPDSIDWIRSFEFHAQYTHLEELGTGIDEEREWDIQPFGVNFESGDHVGLSLQRRYEYLDESFEVSDGIVVERGEYVTREYVADVRTASRRMASFFGRLGYGDFWDGTRTNGFGRVTIRPGPLATIGLGFQYNDVSMPTGDFTANVYEIETQWNPNPWVSATTQLQYDDVSELVGLFVRLRWIVRPGDDVYLVYTHNWQNLGSGLFGRDRELVTLSRGGSVKLNYTYRF